MIQETGCRPTTSKAQLRLESIDFSQIPGQSRLFVQYQTDPLALKKYYPSAVSSHTQVADRVPEVLASYTTDRARLCEILAEQNQRFGAGDVTRKNIALLGEKDCIAVLTGQQAGLFTGPLYTVYKALSAIRMAACLNNRGIKAVPVFWAATEDHDFAEIASATILSRGEEFRFQIPDAGEQGRPVGSLPVRGSFADELSKLANSELSAEVIEAVTAIWTSDRSIGEAFCTHIQQLFRDHGLIVIDPLDPGIKSLVAPVYAQAIDKADEIAGALVARSKELEDDGYHAQVLITPDYFPLFYHTDDGIRRAVRRTDDGSYRVAGSRLEFDRMELHAIAESEPSRFSPNVMLRSAVQDFLFPTVCYFGGGAEIAYFAQNSEVYRILGRPVTPILHRQSFTIVEPKHARTMEKYELGLTDLFDGRDKLVARLSDTFVNPAGAHTFADAEEEINTELNRLDQEISKLDPTLAANLATRRRKILYHIAALRKKYQRSQVERDEVLSRRINSLFTELLPGGQLQERTLNVTSYLLLHGHYFIDWVYDSIDLDDRGHRLLYLQ